VSRRAITLVTGATGFVGAAVTRKLVAAGNSVRVLVRPSSATGNIADLSVQQVRGDLTDATSLRRAVEGCEALYHVAADYRLWVPRPPAMYQVNVEGTAALMEAALEAGVERIVYTSSVAALGSSTGGVPADEETPVELREMVGHYKRSKFLAEERVRELHRERGLPVVTVNPSTPFGPGDVKPTPTGRIVLDAMRGRIPAYVDMGLNIVHVDDVAEGHLLALEKGRPGERYILGGEDMTLREILTEVANLTGRRPPKLRLPRALVMPVAALAEAWARLPWGGEPLVTTDSVRMSRKHMWYSSAKAIRELGYSPRPAREAIHAAVEWFKQWDTTHIPPPEGGSNRVQG
jgi:dihydroflavonol-4-reductase